MKEEITIAFKDQNGFRISKSDITTGKIVINDIEITSVEDWEKVTKSISDLQSQLKAKEEVIKEIKKIIVEADWNTDIEYEILKILSKGENK